MTYDDTDPKDLEEFVDPVSQQPVDPRTAPHQSFYAGRHFYFTDLTNKQTFDGDPQLWVSTPHASVTSASLSPIGEPEN